MSAKRRKLDLRPPPRTKPWIERLARLGYAAKGIVYLIVAWLTLRAARGAGHAPSGSREAFRAVVAQPFGRVAMVAIALGLAGYATWRAVETIADPEGKGDDAKGLAVRTYYLASAAFHASLVVAAGKLVVGLASAGGGDQTPQRTATVMAHPFGRWAVLAIGLGVLAGAVQQVRLAGGRYRKKIDIARVPARTRRVVGAVAVTGMLARALVLAIVGIFLAAAAIHERPQEARGLAGALRTVERQPAGAWLLGVVAVGLAAYGAFELLEARYRAIRP